MRVSGDYGILCVLFAFFTPESLLVYRRPNVVVSGQVLSIDCYACSSIAGNDKGCEDTFDRSLKTVHFIVRDCFYGYFRGTHCYKLKGQRADGSSIMVRHCADSYWGSHCGDIKYTNEHNEEEKISGCLETCDHDGCNTAIGFLPSLGLVCVAAILSHVVWL